MKKKNKSIRDLLIEYFKAHPKQDMTHGPVVDWVEAKYKRLYNKKPRDTWRSIRNLHEVGFLIKVKKGIYRYDPEAVNQRELEDFTPEQKEFILKRDGYKCVQCGRGREDGIELQVDHIKSRYEGGKAVVENGQTLCAQHNFVKKHLKQTETGKKMFIRLYELAKSEKNKELIDFCADVLKDYEKHNINCHIIWEK
ncbi:MAG: HNH endonuclease [Nitrospirae bacterium CG_4_10_14_3_um_filter_44_29]|nr:HNH endonuclease [Nitrospirota bacterium]OIO30339.1 MAG: HNH endonuclease [Nitrospirae bacterium CG1_02_44_142]PIP70983.1 MAG: HNH endonuclease [Nitrospirae bacterium CG22_combo_CG10-13_8_21_14_all_44_11]PIV41427.1 MAG: HNH endonuclease [Nitrospirae bacterium CG02_land_8_20_14_3_00_44_33]PIV65829.1 MAG: HNH endonuclease [Nitrospirae bacterium CG01_land_8_20_14_3_00_44_22]PIW90451.1 MAG: HNH endonuclease [Nitrospirae bacterium CG_4_8_14_3_um_filter_44_28]PIX87408.1 MAG: HNH endonuclease [Ni